jgi:hypothetical protein
MLLVLLILLVEVEERVQDGDDLRDLASLSWLCKERPLRHDQDRVRNGEAHRGRPSSPWRTCWLRRAARLSVAVLVPPDFEFGFLPSVCEV